MHFLPLSHPILTVLTQTHSPAVTSAWPVDARHHGNCSFHSNRAVICRLCQNLLLVLFPSLCITLSFLLLSSLCIMYLILGCWNTQTYDVNDHSSCGAAGSWNTPIDWKCVCALACMFVCVFWMHFEKTSCYNKTLKKFEQKSILLPGSGLIVVEACFIWKY